MSVVTNLSRRTKFKLKSIQVFCSDEWMAGQQKKYRTVFERAELQYIRCELALHNLGFGSESWTLNVTFKCVETTNGLRREICSIDTTEKVGPETDVVYVRDGWGMEEAGAFWKKGTYTWEVYIDEEKVGDASFVINDVGLVRRRENPYFSVEEIRYYAGDYDGWKKQERTYLETFNRNTTGYVWAEVTLLNKTQSEWNYELFFNFYDATRQLKGQVIRTGLTERDKLEYKYIFDIGWGNNKPGSWKSDQYYFDVVFMDKLVASSSFFVSDHEKQGIPSLLRMIE